MFAQAMEIMEQKDLSELQKSIQKVAEENGFDILTLAAAFMQMSMGDEPEEIQEEKPYEKGKREGRGRRDGRSSRTGYDRREGRTRGQSSQGRRGRRGDEVSFRGQGRRGDEASSRSSQDRKAGKDKKKEKSGKGFEKLRTSEWMKKK